MADYTQNLETESAPPPPSINLGKAILEPIDHGIAAMERAALKAGVPVHIVIEMLLNHLASVTAAIEPAGVRAGTIADIQRGFPSLVVQHVTARKTTAGGVLVL